MRILHLVSYPLFSGPVPPTLGLARAQRRQGHTVWVACDARRGDHDGFEEAVAPHLADLRPPWPLQLCSRRAWGAAWGDLRALRRLLRAAAVDVVHVHLSHDHALVRLAAGGPPGGPTVVRTVHAARALARRRHLRWLAPRTDAWIVRCAAHRGRLQAALPGRPAPVRVLPGSIELAAWPAPAAAAARRAAARARLGLPAAAWVVGQVALLDRRGQGALLQAAARPAPGRTPCQVLLVGEGAEAAALRRQATQLGLAGRVHFAGYLRGPALADAYAAMDAAYLAQAGNDAGSRAALEALACGVPLLAVHADALGELLDAGWGTPLPAAEPVALAAAIEALRAAPAAARAAAARAREGLAIGRTFAAEAAATLALYLSCAGCAGAPGCGRPAPRSAPTTGGSPA